jgi:phage terminase large subunit
MPRKVLDDVLAFSEVGLETPLYDWQARILSVIDKCSLLDRVKVAVSAPNGAGKSERVVGVAILRWLNRFPRGRVVLTSADAKQIDYQIMPAIRKHASRFPAWEFLGRSIKTHDNGFFLSFTTDESSRAEGHHKALHSPLLIIIDEAKSVENEIFMAFDRCSFNVELMISSPGLKTGRFFDAFTTHREQFMLVEQISLADCPHISKERIRDVIDTYGENAPFVRSTIFGEFMAEDENTPMAVNFEALMLLMQSPPGSLISRHDYSAFCDFAAGGDENVLAIRSGNKLLELIAWRERDTVSSVGRFIIEFRKHHLRAGQIWGDAGGMGTPMCDMLADAGWSINRFDFGGKASRHDVYYNRGAEIWGKLARMIEKGEIVLINDPTLISQLTTRKIIYDRKGRAQLEPKEDMRARGLKSPDRADAVAGAFALGSASFAKFAKQTDDPWEQLDQYYEGLPEDFRGGSGGSDSALQKKIGGWAGE